MCFIHIFFQNSLFLYRHTFMISPSNLKNIFGLYKNQLNSNFCYINCLRKYLLKYLVSNLSGMYNTSSQKPYSSSQAIPIQIQQSEDDQNQPGIGSLIQSMSSNIFRTVLPIYNQYDLNNQNDKILGCYPVLRFPPINQIKPPPPPPTSHPTIKNKYNNLVYQSKYPAPPPTKVSYSEISRRVQEQQRIQNNHLHERKIHQILDQNEADDDMFSNNNINSQSSEIKKLEKARKYYERLSKELKSNKRMKRKFKDKNRPKKAKSAYNLFVEQVVPQIKAENPTFSAPDLVRVAAKMYNQLTEEEKLPYQRRYLIDKQRFEREREAYFKQNPERDYRLDSKTKASYMDNRPSFRSYMDL